MAKIVLKGVFQITQWDETPYAEHDDGSKQTIAHITQTYSGDITGTANICYVMSHQKDTTAVFSGLERLSVTTPEITGEIMLQHNGTFIAGVAQSQFSIIAGSGTQHLTDYIGQGEFISTENGQAEYMVTLNIA
ncbi:DUF3224 domain-containing protein [Shewanella inventionis]|uniref:DUF3224 domain-containing protein n=1 Tax=Shewanella inventionis TaxID=1738770 RepID=A0ABQ1IMQ2_9GAMM|nr:DUF3224 domain-containing protein [Shewanella inventionis]MCL1159028.1 DUF3224 domain-containing protein [Shewanella inventionis]UAL42469.1 DUF3224 domain-containing protein [Shewanella inventionis]GGB47609.1 hypothetical protein GCM10011607_04840 [Shewanella inventionis]